MLRHAKRIFARKGYHRTNVADIIARARIARGTFYLYFENKKDLFEEFLEQVVGELTDRIQRIRPGPGEADPVDRLRANLTRVLRYVLSGANSPTSCSTIRPDSTHELDDKIQDFYDRIAALIKRSLDLGIEMNLVRDSDTRAVSYAILGGIKEVVGMLSRSDAPDIAALVEEILGFGLRGVARPELFEVRPSAR